MNKNTISKIKSLCEGDIKFCDSENNTITILVPYDIAKFGVEIEGETIKDQVNSFISGVNSILDDMINHLEDCKLSEII